jgi:RNase P subunit RPR2
MSGLGSGGLMIVQADPVSFVACPQCSFPLNTYFSTQHHVDGKKMIVYVACSSCMWAERWGELKIRQEGIEDGARKAATG